MGTVPEADRPNMKRVYVRRRLTVLAVLLAVIVAGVLIVWQPGSGGGGSSARDVEVPEDLAASAKSESAQSGDPDDSPQCGAGQLRVLPVTDRDSYAPGEQPQLSLSVENVGEATCHADLGTATMVFEISSGSDQIWRSTDCQQNATQLPVLLEPGTPLTTKTLEWDRTRSNIETCEVGQDIVADAGGATYHLRVEIAGVSGEGTAPFLLY